MIAWLVEEHVLNWSGGEETISWHAIVQTPTFNDADSTQWARNAFHMAERIHRQETPESVRYSDDDWSFAFGMDELEVAVKGFLWHAADGSSIAYEVRRLGEVVMDCTRGKVEIK